MATSPQPPRPPAPPYPPSGRRNWVVIALLLLALLLLAGGMGVWVGLRFLASNVHIQVNPEGGGKKEVSINTPMGSLQVNHGVSEERLGLPIYPGATRITDHGSATVNIDITDETRVRVLVGKFETPDPIDKVRDFYRSRLGDQVTDIQEKNTEGKTIFKIKHDKQEKAVALKSGGRGTIIELVRVTKGQGEAN